MAEQTVHDARLTLSVGERCDIVSNQERLLKRQIQNKLFDEEHQEALKRFVDNFVIEWDTQAAKGTACAQSIRASCREAPFLRPTPRQLEHFSEYVDDHFDEWYQYGLVVIEIPEEEIRRCCRSKEEMEKIIQETSIVPRVQRFPQTQPMSPSYRKRKRSGKTSRFGNQVPGFKATPFCCSIAAYRNVTESETERLLSIVLEGIKARRVWNDSEKELSERERLKLMEDVFWRLLESGTGRYIYQVLYGIDVCDVSGFRDGLAHPPFWSPASANQSQADDSSHRNKVHDVSMPHCVGKDHRGSPSVLSLLRFLPELSGITKPMCYFGSGFSRFCFHYLLP